MIVGQLSPLFLILVLLPFEVISGDGSLNLLELKTETPASVQKQAVSDLIERLLPQKSSHFEVIINEQFVHEHLDKYRIEEIGSGRFRITANTGVSASLGLNHFLKYIANCSISWSGDQLDLPPLQQLHLSSGPIEQIIYDKLRYYQNVCTVSYSMVWWNWARWQREIDWMALRGINMPLAFNGQELVFRNTFNRFNLSEAEIDDFFSGPAFLAWNRMGNIQKWSGPLSQAWHEGQTRLQQQILERMRSFGMFPVGPAFAGHVPRSLVQHLPRARVENLTDWNKFGHEYSFTSFLQPDDPNFALISTAYLEEYDKLYGLTHFYNLDLFNEVNPSTNDPNKLKSYGKAILDSLEKVDPKAVWIMQGWMFYDKPFFWGSKQIEAMVTSVPRGRMIVLDLFSDVHPVYSKTKGYFGQTFLWCMLQNFGGTLGLYGPINRINDELYRARANYKNMVGSGLTPEGIHQNDVVFDYMTETVLHSEPPNMEIWFRNYSQRRYGFYDRSLDQAWQLLRVSVYQDNIGVRNHGNYGINLRPRLGFSSVLWYEPSNVTDAFRLFAHFWAKSNASELIQKETLVADTVDLARQVLQLTFDAFNQQLEDAFYRKDVQLFAHLVDRVMHLFELKDNILACSRFFLLHAWIKEARDSGTSIEEKDTYEEMAKNQITLWGPDANIIDYAGKQWTDMYRYYYQPRWQLYLHRVNESMVTNTTFNNNAFIKEVFSTVELPFTRAKHPLKEKAMPENLPGLLPQVLSFLDVSN